MLSLHVSDDILLKTYKEEDAEELFSTVQNNRAHLRPWLLWVDATLKQEHSLEYIRAARQEQYDQRSIALGIFQEGKLIGGIGMHAWDQKVKKAQIGYWLAKSAEGNGIVQQSARVLITYLFTRLQLNKIELHYLPHNNRSALVAQRLGFQVEGVLRDHFLMNGALHPIVIAGLLRKEWEASDSGQASVN